MPGNLMFYHTALDARKGLAGNPCQLTARIMGHKRRPMTLVPPSKQQLDNYPANNRLLNRGKNATQNNKV